MNATTAVKKKMPSHITVFDIFKHAIKTTTSYTTAGKYIDNVFVFSQRGYFSVCFRVKAELN